MVEPGVTCSGTFKRALSARHLNGAVNEMSDSEMCGSDVYATWDFPRYRGINVSATNVSNEVGVVFSGDRFS